MRSLISIAMLASVSGPLAGTAVAADLDYPPPPPPPYYEPHPVPPAFVPGPVPPVYYRGPRLYPRPVVYPRPYPAYGPGPVVRVYPGPGPYAEGYDRPLPREPRPYGEPGYRPGYGHEAELDRGRDGYDTRERGGYDRGPDRGGYDRGRPDRGFERDSDRGGEPRYGHYLSREELDRRADRERGESHDRYAEHEHGYDREHSHDHYADRAPPRDFDR